MEQFLRFLNTSYTAYHAVENLRARLLAAGFTPLGEGERWTLSDGGAYFVVRGGSLIAFRYRASGPFRIVASHTDSPCFKLKAGVSAGGGYTRLNTEPYGGGLWYTFFDRPLRIAGRVARKTAQGIATETAAFGRVVLPSLAVHMQRDANEKFTPNLQTDLPLFALKEAGLPTGEDVLSFDLFAVPDEAPFFSGAHEEFLSSPRLDDLAGVYASLEAFLRTECGATAVCAFFEAEEIGSRTAGGAAGDLLRATVERIEAVRGGDRQDLLCDLSSSFLLSLDGAHALHPNHPEACDPESRPLPGGGIAIKSHAGGAYTTDARTSAAVKAVLRDAGIPFQDFYNRSDMRSGSTLGALSLGQLCVPSADLGIAQLAMHSAVETMAKEDYFTLQKGLAAYFGAETLL